MLSTEQESLNLEFALREKQFACIQNITDGRYVMGILPTFTSSLLFTVGHRKKYYTQCRWALDLVRFIGRKTTHDVYEPWTWRGSSEGRLHTMSMSLGLGAVHRKEDYTRCR